MKIQMLDTVEDCFVAPADAGAKIVDLLAKSVVTPRTSKAKGGSVYANYTLSKGRGYELPDAWGQRLVDAGLAE